MVELTVRKLHPLLGAEVRGVDLRTVPDAATFQQLHDIWMEHLVLVFPSQDITDEQHVAFTRLYGDLEVHHQKIIRSRFMPEIFRVSNVNDDNELMPPSHPTVKQVHLAQFWHTDSSFRRMPCTGSLLHGVEVSRTGGETHFTNMYAVYDALPDSIKHRIEGKRALHDFGHLHKLAELRPQTEEEKAAMPPVWQPLVRIHPVTGRKSLYISPIYNDEIEGIPQAEARRIIAELTELSAESRFVYKHQWETHDIVQWDNRCTMHHVTPHDATERRVMHRTTIAGTAEVLAA